MMRLFLILLIFTVINGANAESTVQYHSHENIRATVNDFLSGNLQPSDGIEFQTTIGQLDPRLKLAKCDSPLSAFTASDINQSARFSIGIKCTGHKPWSLYVTVNIKKITDLYVSASPLSRGDMITEEHIHKVKRDINKLRQGFYSNKQDLIGMIAKRSIRAGTILSSKHLTPPIIIQKGDNVDIMAKTPSLVIRMEGKAMSDGAIGQKIRVRNKSSRRIVDAVVVSQNLVKVRM